MNCAPNQICLIIAGPNVGGLVLTKTFIGRYYTATATDVWLVETLSGTRSCLEFNGPYEKGEYIPSGKMGFIRDSSLRPASFAA